MARIVRPGGGIALFWNVRDAERSPFVADYHRLLAERFGEADTGEHLQAGHETGQERTRTAVERAGGFERAGAPHPRALGLDHRLGLHRRAFTASYVRSLSADEQDRFRIELGGILGRHGHNDETPFDLPYRIDLWIARRHAS